MENAVKWFQDAIIRNALVVQGPLDLMTVLVKESVHFTYEAGNPWEVIFKIGHWNFYCNSLWYSVSSAVSSETMKVMW